ncbi:MAG: dihydroxy-acid dehydratase [Pseudomonadota bacterium]
MRYVGPRGAPGMPEILKVTAAIAGARLEREIAVIIDERCSGGSRGTLVGHVAPEAFDGGPNALVQGGDAVTIELERRELDLGVSQNDLIEREFRWSAPSFSEERALLARFRNNVAAATHGYIT